MNCRQQHGVLDQTFDHARRNCTPYCNTILIQSFDQWSASMHFTVMHSPIWASNNKIKSLSGYSHWLQHKKRDKMYECEEKKIFTSSHQFVFHEVQTEIFFSVLKTIQEDTLNSAGRSVVTSVRHLYGVLNKSNWRILCPPHQSTKTHTGSMILTKTVFSFILPIEHQEWEAYPVKSTQ